MKLRAIGQAIVRAFVGDPGEPQVIDHLAVSGGPDWRDAKLKAAAQKYGRPFKCADGSVPREIIVDGKITTLRPGEKPRATVTALSTRRKTK